MTLPNWNERTEISAEPFVFWLGIASSKFLEYRGQYGKVNERNARIPRDGWIGDEET